jgi:hypothetical protein
MGTILYLIKSTPHCLKMAHWNGLENVVFMGQQVRKGIIIIDSVILLIFKNNVHSDTIYILELNYAKNFYIHLDI